MSYDFSKIKQRGEEIDDWLRKEYLALQTGRANPGFLDGVLVGAYGSKQPIKNVAAINIEGPRSLFIEPWDKSVIQDIERAIAGTNLGVSTAPDERGVRISFPELTEESRLSLVKIVHKKLEESKISVRTERDEVWNDMQEKEKNKEISEDDKFRYKDELQKIVDDINKNLDEIASKKETDIKN